MLRFNCGFMTEMVLFAVLVTKRPANMCSSTFAALVSIDQAQKVNVSGSIMNEHLQQKSIEQPNGRRYFQARLPTLTWRLVNRHKRGESGATHLENPNCKTASNPPAGRVSINF
jgi:hypothetical protein